MRAQENVPNGETEIDIEIDPELVPALTPQFLDERLQALSNSLNRCLPASSITSDYTTSG